MARKKAAPFSLLMFTVVCTLSAVVVPPPSAIAQEDDHDDDVDHENIASSIISEVLEDDDGGSSSSDAEEDDNVQDAANTAATEDSNQGQTVDQDDTSTFGDDIADLEDANVAVPIGVPVNVEEEVVTPPPQEEQDTTPPTLTVPEDITAEATSPDGAVVRFEVTAEDNVDGAATLEEDDGTTVTQDDVGGDITISCDPPSGSTFPIGSTEVVCTATDEAGNTGTASFTVTVQDTTAPTLTVPEGITVEATSSTQRQQVTYRVTAQDNVDGTATLNEDNTLTQDDDVGGSITIICSQPSGILFPAGTIGVECTATDEAGNTGTASFTVTVIPVTCGPGLVFATIVGTPGDDEITGTEDRDVIAARGGNDEINALGGNDLICGDGGNDVMFGGAGNDGMFGGAGNDEMHGEAGDEVMFGEAGDDEMHGEAGFNQMFGGDGDDDMFGGDDTSNFDFMLGDAGTDFADGGAGSFDVCGAETQINCEASRG
jgi:Ca2+-binding RTX toxin-like protein